MPEPFDGSARQLLSNPAKLIIVNNLCIITAGHPFFFLYYAGSGLEIR